MTGLHWISFPKCGRSPFHDPGVTPDFMKQLLWDNPAKCFNLKV